MKKNTELFIDYLKENELPEIFGEIEGFESQFIKYYCDSEIGFETENLFKIKLELYSELYIPQYKSKIEKFDIIFNEISDFKRKIKRTHKFGEQLQNKYILPENVISELSNILANEKLENSKYENIEIEERNELSFSDIINLLNFLLDEKQNILLQLIKEFENLFMGIY